jgi:hypothetical protein
MIGRLEDYDHKDPLKRCKFESRNANQALRDYAHMGPRRAADGLVEFYQTQRVERVNYRPPSLRRTTITGWSVKYRWVERAHAWEDIEIENDDVLWKQRRKDIKERDFVTSNRLRELADGLLSEAPNFFRTTRRIIPAKAADPNDPASHGEPEREVITVALDAGQGVRFLEVASRLQRLSAGMDNRAPLPTVDLNNLSDDKLKRLANGEDIWTVLSDSGPSNPDSAG